MAIRGATILTVTRGTIQNGTIVLRDGKIAAVGGADTQVPAGADVIDASGRFVSPGIIDAHSHIAADSINEGGTTVSSMTGIGDVLDPTDVDLEFLTFVAGLLADYEARGFDAVLDDGPLPIVLKVEREGYSTVIKRFTTFSQTPTLDAVLASPDGEAEDGG